MFGNYIFDDFYNRSGPGPCQDRWRILPNLDLVRRLKYRRASLVRRRQNQTRRQSVSVAADRPAGCGAAGVGAGGDQEEAEAEIPGSGEDLRLRVQWDHLPDGLVNEAEILTTLTEANMARCVPPLDTKELERIVTSAGKYKVGTVKKKVATMDVEMKAQRFSDLISQDGQPRIRFCQNHFWRFDGRRWERLQKYHGLRLLGPPKAYCYHGRNIATALWNQQRGKLVEPERKSTTQREVRALRKRPHRIQDERNIDNAGTDTDGLRHGHGTFILFSGAISNGEGCVHFDSK